MWLDFKDSQLLPRQKLPTPLYNWDSAVSNRQQNTTPQPPTDTLRGYNQDLFSEKKKGVRNHNRGKDKHRKICNRIVQYHIVFTCF